MALSAARRECPVTMPDLVPVDAGWALWSKQAGTREDYSVLSTSTGQFSRADFSAILTRFTPGTPPTEKEGLGTLPWVTISWVGVGGSLHLGMAVQTASDDADGLGRPITRTQYFCVPYAALKEHRISYTELHDAVKSLQLPPQDGDPVRLLLRRLDPEEAAGSIRELGEPAVETTAGLLLQGPVSVVRAEASTLPERLAFIEAVAALLPYGYRAKFTAATWTDSGSRHRIRLAFAERPRDGAQLVSWRERAADPASDRVFRAYLTQLNRLQQAHPSGTRQAFTLPQIIGYTGRGHHAAEVRAARSGGGQSARDRPAVRRAGRSPRRHGGTGQAAAPLRRNQGHRAARRRPADGTRGADQLR